jgi:diguanylate cyclase (GGDEF)-like protein
VSAVLIVTLIISLFAAITFFIYFKKQLCALRQENKTLSHTISQLEEHQKTAQSEKHLLESQLQSSQRDVITGLPTWSVFEDRLHQAIKESERYQLTVGVMMVDLDHFKTLNDALGHVVGDAVLKETAKRLSTCIRQVDSIARQTKDRFVVLLAQLSKAERAAIVAARMLEAVSEPFQMGEHEFYLTACIGIAFYPVDGKEADTLLHHADNALSLAKQKGKHLYQFHQQDVHLQSQRDLALATHLRKETIFDELQLYYQPIVDVHSNKIMCMEALLYWRHPDYGLIAPSEFFQYAENQRQSTVFCEWLIRKAFQQYLTWQAQGMGSSLLAIPVFMHQLENSQFVYQITQLFQEYKLDPQHVLIEMKEESTQVAYDKVANAIARFKYIGTQVALCNFGVGQMPLAELKQMRFDYLKLDARCISDMADHFKTRQFIKSLLLFAEANDMKLIIQGVHSTVEVDLLKEMGAHLQQGDVLWSPLSVREVEERVLAI